MNNTLWVAIMAANAGRAAVSSSCSNASDTSVVTGLIIIIGCVVGLFLLLLLFEAIDDWIS
jgi:hypothetical protein